MYYFSLLTPPFVQSIAPLFPGLLHPTERPSVKSWRGYKPFNPWTVFHRTTSVLSCNERLEYILPRIVAGEEEHASITCV